MTASTATPSPAETAFALWKNDVESRRVPAGVRQAFLAGFQDGLAHEARKAGAVEEKERKSRPVQIGDCVQLKCGGPVMVVAGIADYEDKDPLHKMIDCEWFNAADEVRSSTFDSETLRYAS